MAISKKDAHDLAVAYQAFLEAASDNHSAISVWGKMLLVAQEKTRIELCDNWWLKARIARAESMYVPAAK